MYADILIREVISWQVKNHTAKYILICIAKYTDAEGVCFPSIDRLSLDTELSKRSVIRAVNYLIKTGFLIKKRGNVGHSNVYQFTCLIDEGDKMAHEDKSNIVRLIMGNKASSDKLALSKFDEFWKVYPRKVGKGHARIAFVKSLKLVEADILIEAAATFARVSKCTEKKYIPHPTTWLNAERWDDEVDDIANQSNTDRLNDILDFNPMQQLNNLTVIKKEIS